MNKIKLNEKNVDSFFSYKNIFFLIKITFLKNLHIIDIKALYFLLLKDKVRIKSSIRVKKNIGNNLIKCKKL